MGSNRRAAVLSGIGSWLPPRTVSNHDLAARLDTSDEWIRSRTGIVQRHVVEPGMSTGHLATEAGARALESASVDRVELVLVATTTPDRPCPATAPDVASRLGMSGVPAFDIAAVCTGFLYGLATASGFIASGQADSVLVVAAETFSSILNPQDRSTAVIFGDGAGAVVLRAGDPAEHGALLAVDLGSDGRLAELIMVPGGGSLQRSSGVPMDPTEAYFTMQGRDVYVNAVQRMTSSSRAVLARAGWRPGEVDAFIAHQANLRILQSVAERVGIAEGRTVVNIDRVANTASASVPLALAHAAAEGILDVGSRVLLTAFGGGATWGSAAFRWPELDRA
jgi:3-oxoacyl-[acyl-carrier-protein] synthase-3